MGLPGIWYLLQYSMESLYLFADEYISWKEHYIFYTGIDKTYIKLYKIQAVAKDIVPW